MENAIFASALGSNSASSLLLIVAMVAIFYFMLIRPQRKEQKRKEEMLSGMDIGDTVLTTSGFYGVLIDIADDTVIVEFGSNRNCRIPMQKAAIMAVEKPEGAVAKAETKSEAKTEEAKDTKEAESKED